MLSERDKKEWRLCNGVYEKSVVMGGIEKTLYEERMEH